jgi:hypothetical protein
VNELRDPIAYRIAIGVLGIAVALVFGGVAWTAALGEQKWVPDEIWFAGGALGGVFVGPARAVARLHLETFPPHR